MGIYALCINYQSIVCLGIYYRYFIFRCSVLKNFRTAMNPLKTDNEKSIFLTFPLYIVPPMNVFYIKDGFLLFYNLVYEIIYYLQF